MTEIIVKSGSVCAGRSMKGIEWPQESLIAPVRRGRKVFIPHGDTRLEARDVLVMVGNEAAIQSISRLCMPKGEEI